MNAMRMAAALAMLLMCAADAQAQDDEPRKVALRGRVVDAVTGQPVPVTVVRSLTAARAVVTDSAGEFLLPGLKAGSHEMEAGRIGYDAVTLLVNVTGNDSLVVELKPLPINLEAITAIARTLERRRKRVPAMVRAYDAATLAVANEDLRQFLRTHAVPLVAGPPTGINARPLGDDCVFTRGRYRAITLFFNEMPFTGPPLSIYNPSEFELVEYYPSSATVRVYTAEFIERVARGKGFISHIVQ
jgi:hypothetical protein